MKLGSTLTVFLAGTITGILIAPKKGEQTREDLAKFYGDARKELEKNWENSSEILQDVANKVKDFTDKAFAELENYRKQLAEEQEQNKSSTNKDNETHWGG